MFSNPISKVGSFFYSRWTPTGWQYDEPLSTSTELTLIAAEKYGITYREIPGTRIFELKYGDQVSYIQAQNPFPGSVISIYATLSKEIEKQLLREAKVSVSDGFTIQKHDSKEYWQEIFGCLTKPLVLKPTHGNQGQAVHMNISTYTEFETLVTKILPMYPSSKAGCIVEEMFNGEEYRILATSKKIIGICNRKPANVIGDGKSTIQELIDLKNRDPRRNPNPNNYLVTIKVDDHVMSHLAAQKLSLSTVPLKDQQVFLRQNSNISTGGDSIDVTDIVHESVSEIALKTMQAFPGLEFAGIDFMTKDITQAQTPNSYIIVEVNNTPGYSIHDLPYEGKNRHAADEFLKILFPNLELQIDE